MPVTQDQIIKVQTDFNAILDDVLTMVPHSPTVDIAVMMFIMAEASIVSLMQQNVIKVGQ